MMLIGKFALFGGFLLAVIAQISISVLAFKKDFRDGLLCLLMPGDIFVFAFRKETRHTKLLAGAVNLSVGYVHKILNVNLRTVKASYCNGL